MIELTHKENKIKLMEKLSIKQYQNLMNHQLSGLSTIEIISILTEIPIDDLKQIDSENYRLLEKVLIPLLHIPQMDKITFMFNFDGKDYGLVQDFFKLTMSEWIDLQVYSNENQIQNIHKIMALLYRPITKKLKNNKYEIENYDSKTLDERSELFKELPIEYYLSVTTFFLQNVNKFMEILETSLKQKNQKMKIKMMWKKLMKTIYQKIKILFRGSTGNV